MTKPAPTGYTTVASWIMTWDGVVTAPATQAFGQRGGRVRDPFGNIWWISAVVEDVPPEEGMRRLSEPAYADAMREAQETLDRELSGREHVVASRPVVR